MVKTHGRHHSGLPQGTVRAARRASSRRTLSGQSDVALALLAKASAVLPPVTRLYWEARIRYSNGAIVEAARALLQAWAEAEKLPPAVATEDSSPTSAPPSADAERQGDRDPRPVHRRDGAPARRRGPTRRATGSWSLFAKLMELRGTYQLTRIAATGDVQDAAAKHEEAVEQVFGMLQDARLDLSANGHGRRRGARFHRDLPRGDAVTERVSLAVKVTTKTRPAPGTKRESKSSVDSARIAVIGIPAVREDDVSSGSSRAISG